MKFPFVRSSCGVLAEGKKLYVFGGYTPNTSSRGKETLRDVDCYDPDHNPKWYQVESMIVCRSPVNVVALPGGQRQLSFLGHLERTDDGADLVRQIHASQKI
jgi:N-acetylneuraminic acid mutarotase